MSEGKPQKAEQRKLRFATSSDIELKPYYTPSDVAADPDRDIGQPGEFPYTRGVQPTMYRGRLWTMRQYAGYASAAESNRRYRFLLDQGQTGLSVAFDLPTQIGYDADDPIAEGEVGKVGVSICRCAAGIAVRSDSVEQGQYQHDDLAASVLLAMYIAVASNGGSTEELRGTIQNDILKDYIARTRIFHRSPLCA
jgi:methylmalonyl-CoA mutase N-terminal domain/subunit